MAADDALARTLADGEGVLRLYAWSPPTVSFGRNEPARGLYDRSGAEAAGVDFVRRPTGGRAVLHDREVTYAVIVPLPRRGLREVYRAIHGAVMEGLRSIGLGVEAAPTPERAPGLDAGPCFGATTGGEILLGGRKLVGSAQARIGDALLQHGSLLLGTGQELLERLGPGRTGPAAGWTTLDDGAGSAPTQSAVRDALARGFRTTLPGEWGEDAWREREREVAERLLDRYRSLGWTWRW